MGTIIKRHSKQRDCILKVLADTDSHPTANQIYDMVREEIPNISLGTVYRNLATLSKEGDILKLTVGDNNEHYDATTTPHYHFFCQSCGRVYDAYIDYFKKIDSVLENNLHCRVDYHRVMFYGTCSDCQKK